MIIFKWDLGKKSKILKERNLNFEDLKELFERSYHLSQKNDDPEQWRAIGWIQGKLVTLIYEEREDIDGAYIWFVTAWFSTNTEKRLFYEG